MTDTTDKSLSDQAEALLTRLESIAPDHEPFFISGFVHRLLRHYGQIAAIWCVEDVQGIRPDLTAEQAREVLEEVGRKHDTEYGISWTTLECMADILFGSAPEIDEAAEVQP
jgi:hypothetical protein